MALDKLVDSTQLDSDLTSVANAIRTKGGTSAQLAFPAGFVSAIGAIPTGGNLPFGLVKVKTLIDTTFTADSDITAATNEVALYTLDPLLESDYEVDDAFFILGYVEWRGSKAVADIENKQFLASASALAVPRGYGANNFTIVTQPASVSTRYTSNWSYCGSNLPIGLYLNSKSASTTNIVLKLQMGVINNNCVAKAGNYAVKANLYKFNSLQLEGTLP